MTLARITPVSSVPSGNADHGDNPGSTMSPPVQARALNPDLVHRFRALIEEVTDELMQDRHLDRRTCRADAIALLIATSQHVDDPSEGGESPLMYLLLEEQQKAAAVLGQADIGGQLPAFLRV